MPNSYSTSWFCQLEEPLLIQLSQWRQCLYFTQMPMELWYLTTTTNALPITMSEPIVRRWGTIGYNMKLQMSLLRQEVIVKNKTKWELSALVSSCSLDERTAVKSQINSLYLTSWYRHHNTILGSKICIKRTQCHPDALWWYGFLSAYSCTLQN